MYKRQVQSQRYVRLDGFEYVTPPEVAADPEASAAFEQAMRAENEQYELSLIHIWPRQSMSRSPKGITAWRLRITPTLQAPSGATRIWPSTAS